MASDVKYLMTVDHIQGIPYDEWHRFELIEGRLYVSCAPGISHQLVLNNLQFELAIYLRENPFGTLVPGPGVELSRYNYVIPDMVFVRNERWMNIVANDQFNAAPDLVIEIVSRNRERDIKLKHALYAKYGVQEYWAVECWSRSVIVFRLHGNTLEEVMTLNENDILESPLFPGLSLKLSSIFATDEHG